MDKIKQQQNRGYLVAGIGALVALLAILLLPYALVTLNVSGTASGTTVNGSGILTLNATALAQNLSAIIGSTQIQNQGVLWLLPILALVALVLTGLVVFRDHPFGTWIKAPLAMQKRWGNYTLIGVAVLSVLIQIVVLSNLGSQIQNFYNNALKSSSGSGSGLTSINVSTGTLAGFWLFLLGMAAVAAGAIFLLVQERKQIQSVQAVPNMSGGQPYQPLQSPAPFDPYSQQYPPQQVPQAQPYPPQQPQQYPSQQPQQAQPYPPQQPQQYPSQQWPPSSNQPQPPYPTGQ